VTELTKTLELKLVDPNVHKHPRESPTLNEANGEAVSE